MNPYGLPPYMPPNGAPPMVPPYMNQPGMVPQPMGFGTVVAASAPVLTNPAVARPSGTPLIPAITTVYVGKIAPTVEDDFIRRLLDQCGKVKNWRRIADPVSGKLKGFGFCDYESPEGVLRALRLLANVKLDGTELLLKVDEKTQKLLDVYLKANQVNEPKQKEEDDAVNATLTFLLTRRAREMGLLEQDLKSRDKGTSNVPTTTTTAPTTTTPNATVTPTAAIIPEPSKETSASTITTTLIDKEKEKEARRRDREEREYRDRERSWEDREISKLKEREKEYFKLKKQAQRLDRDLSYDDNERKKRSKEYYRRKRDREKEREEDEVDRQKEIQEKEMIQQHLEKKRRELEALNEPPPPPTLSPERDQQQSDNTSMEDYSMQQSTYTPPSLSYTTITMSPVEDNTMSPVDRSRLSGFALSTTSKEKKPVVPLAAGFATEGEHDDVYSNKKKKLTTLDAHMQEENERKAKLEQLKNLIDTIPTEKTQLFAIQVNWELIDQHQIPERKMRPWIAKKIVEYLGEEEKTLIEFILSKVVAHTPPYELLEQLSVVLDEEAETFVLKMWRMLVFEMLAIQNNLQTS